MRGLFTKLLCHPIVIRNLFNVLYEQLKKYQSCKTTVKTTVFCPSLTHLDQDSLLIADSLTKHEFDELFVKRPNIFIYRINIFALIQEQNNINNLLLSNMPQIMICL